MRAFITCLILVGIGYSGFCADITLTSETIVRFARVEEGKQILSNQDDYISSLSPFDRQARLMKTEPVSEEDYIDFITKQVLEWDDDSITAISKTVESAASKLKRFNLRLPEIVTLIKTTGREESGAKYTRQNAIVIPGDSIDEQTFIHELFHVFSRYNPEMRIRLYEIIGFHPCKNIVELPDSLKSRQITNPDAPLINSYIEVTYRNESIQFVPILYSSQDYQSGSFFKTMLFRLMAIEERDGRYRYKTVEEKPLIVDVQDVDNFHSQIGRNTAYIIHPEEILADNFAMLVRERKPKTRRIIQEMERLLTVESSESSLPLLKDK